MDQCTVFGMIDYALCTCVCMISGVIELQGGVTIYVGRVKGGSMDMEVEYEPEAQNAIFTDLDPSTQFMVTVTMVMHGGAVITSVPIFVKTFDGGKNGKMLTFK